MRKFSATARALWNRRRMPAVPTRIVSVSPAITGTSSVGFVMARSPWCSEIQ